MREADAKKLWCPFVRTGLTAGMAVNRHVMDKEGAIDGVHDETRCIASGCMMWRHFDIDDATRGTASRHGGYCGLAPKEGAK